MPIAVSRGQALRGVRPVVDGGTGGADAATARTNLSVHTEAEHATFHADDDSLVLSGRFTVLNTADIDALSDAAGQTLLQDALNTYDTVFIRRTGSGLINWGSTNYSIIIPQFKTLAGIGAGGRISDQFNYAPYFFLTGTSQRFYLYEGSTIRNFGFDLSNPSASNTTPLIQCQGSDASRLVSHIRVDYGGGGNRNHPVVGANATDAVRIQYCTAWAIPTTFSNQGVFQSGGASANEAHGESGCYYCTVWGQNATKQTAGYGFRCYYGNIIGCKAYRTGDHGFYWLPSAGNSPTRIVDNMAWDCNGSGFFQGSSVSDNGWFMFHGNKAHLSGDHGVYLPYNRTSIFHGIAHDNYSVLSNQNASGSSNYLFGNAHLNTQNF